GSVAGPGSSGRREGSAVWLFTSPGAPGDRSAVDGSRSPPRRGASLAGKLSAARWRVRAAARSGVVPERLGKRVAQVGARDPDIGHEAVEAGKHGGLAPVLAGARETFRPGRHQRHKREQGAHQSAAGNGQNGDICVHRQSPFSPRFERPNSAYARTGTTRNPHPISLVTVRYCTAWID